MIIILSFAKKMVENSSILVGLGVTGGVAFTTATKADIETTSPLPSIATVTPRHDHSMRFNPFLTFRNSQLMILVHLLILISISDSNNLQLLQVTESVGH